MFSTLFLILIDQLIFLGDSTTLLQVLFREASAKHWKDLDGATRLACEEQALEDQVGIEIFSETNSWLIKFSTKHYCILHIFGFM